MKFDKNKILTVVTADQARVGQKGWFASNVETLARLVREEQPKELLGVNAYNAVHAFKTAFQNHALFYPAPEGSMTELMKRYEAETGDLKPIDCCTTHLLGWYERLSKWLESQLTWRPASEKPEKKDMYVVECKPYTGCDSTIVTTAWYDGERFPWNDVVKWIPIPPQGE